MTIAILLAALASLVTSLLGPIAVLPALRRWQVIDVPSQRSAHEVVTPRGGGLGILLALAVGTAIAWLLGTPIGGAVVAALLLTLTLGAVGFAEDASGLSVKVRLALQYLPSFAAAAVILHLSDVVWAWAIPLGFIGLYCVNMANFMDGVNGISAFHGILLGAYITVVASIVGSPNTPGLMLLGAITTTAFLGFLPWNFPKAKLFLGDVGSYILGALFFGALVLLWLVSGSILLSIAPIVIYSADVLTTLAIRAYRREPLTQAHSDHAYQCIRRRSQSHVVASLYTAGATGGVMIITICSLIGVLSTLLAWVLVLVVTVTYLAAGRLVGTPNYKLSEV